MPAIKQTDLRKIITGEIKATLRFFLIANNIKGMHNAIKHDIQTKGTNEYWGLTKEMGMDMKQRTTKRY